MSDARRQVSDEIVGIQYLRALAVVMVVLHHARHYFPEGNTWTAFGSRGVDIFFVVSGFVMAHTTRRNAPATWNSKLAFDFMFRRVVRVVPLYWLALLWTAKREALAGLLGWDFVKDLLFIPHFHATYRDGIFPALVPGWTINYEMFFYALFAFSLLFGSFRFKWLGSAIAALVGLGAVRWTVAPMIFYTSSVMVEFLLGILVYEAVRRFEPPRDKRLLATIAVAALALLGIGNPDELRGFADGPFAAIVVWALVHASRGVHLPSLKAIGDASYSIYLFHLASFFVAAAVLNSLGVERPSALNVALALCAHLAIALIAGTLIYRWLERPLLALMRREWRRSTQGHLT